MTRFGRAMVAGLLCGLTLAGSAPAFAARAAAPTLEAGQRVNLNTASVDELLQWVREPTAAQDVNAADDPLDHWS